ncbi:ROK family transcriptional regulator [Pararhizobium sp. YC-54]|uniref:ROK family transcriptional regulator n=1 Tax=Pararhizobium sp. YC-54 TaxID=2986920 RepID=UPI0021F788B3|nr:ROK family transcriptional regulator [Pararhizobium sp. YC-54]MCW0000269.1 ROK family transcriptional regulator [Pararhizobium sp. YC-54]
MLIEKADLGGLSGSHQRLIRLLRRSAPASRAELAALCGLTPAAVSMLIHELMTRGIVVESGRRQGHRGPPQIDLRLSPKAGYALGIHADYYSVYLTVLDFCGKLRGEHRIHNSFANFGRVAATIAECADALLARSGIAAANLIGAGFALPIRFRNREPALELAEDVGRWGAVDIAATLHDALGCPVIVENDANAAAIGELTVGNPEHHKSFFHLYLGSGIGGAIVLNGNLYRGYIGNAGEIGALRPRSVCRPSFDDLAAWLKADGVTLPVGRDPDEWEAVLAAAPESVERWTQRAGPEAARLAFAAGAILDPPAIYIGGTLPKSVRRALTRWMDFSRQELFDGGTLAQPRILLSEIPAANSAALGAAALVLHQ